MSIDPDRAFLKTLRLLYVEDDEDMRLLLTLFLQQRVSSVVEAGNGAEGLARYEESRADLVLTDILMPKMDGLTMAAELRRREPRLPILVSTAFEEIGFLRRAIELGVDQYVTKPIDTEKLDAALLATARRLRAEQSLAREHQRELDALRTRHLESLALLAGGLAHDFNNLVHGITLSVDLAQEDVEPGSELHDLLSAALENARKAGVLGQQLVTLASVVLDRQLSALRPLLERSLREALAQSKVSYTLELPPDLPEVAVDLNLLGRVFSGLAQNAREAMGGRGALRVCGRARRVDEGEVPLLTAGAYISLTFADEGPGIPPEVLSQVFEPYFSTKQRGAAKGMGLGLALCLAIVREHGGTIVAGSAPGEGATFDVLLPLPDAR